MPLSWNVNGIRKRIDWNSLTRFFVCSLLINGFAFLAFGIYKKILNSRIMIPQFLIISCTPPTHHPHITFILHPTVYHIQVMWFGILALHSHPHVYLWTETTYRQDQGMHVIGCGWWWINESWFVRRFTMPNEFMQIGVIIIFWYPSTEGKINIHRIIVCKRRTILYCWILLLNR